MEVHGLLREHIVVELGAIIIGHGRHIVDYYLIRLCLEIRKSGVIMVVLDKVDMMLKDGRGLVARLYVIKELIVHSVHNGSDVIVKHLGYLIGIVYLRVVITLSVTHQIVMLLIELDIRLSVAVLYNIYFKVVDDLCIKCSDTALPADICHLSSPCILAVLAEVCDNITDSDNTAF